MMAKNKVLIVDDEPDILRVLEIRLSDAGYFVIKADNGNDALKLAKIEHPDLILLDIIMPDIDGVRVSQALKDDPETRDIPVIFLTCLFTKKEEVRGGHSIAGSFFVAKPYNPDELLGVIKKTLISKD